MMKKNSRIFTRVSFISLYEAVFFKNPCLNSSAFLILASKLYISNYQCYCMYGGQTR